MLIRFTPVGRRIAPAVAALMLVTLAVAGTVAAPAVNEPAGGDDLPAEETVPLHPVEAGQATFVDPSADQVWQADQAATSVPEPASAEFALAGPATAPAGFPVSVTGVSQDAAAPAFAATSGKVSVSVADAATAEAAGVDGMLVSLSGSGRGPTEVSVDYSEFADRYGGAWASRLRLVELPACALTTPQKPGCLAVTPLDSQVDRAGQVVSARVELAGGTGLATVDGGASQARVLAVTAGSESEGAGDYRATDLSAAGSWSSGGGTGEFSYGYPLRVPPAAGPVPSLSLGYSSASHDGRTSGRNAQASWIGDGWGYHPGFVERSYRPCALDDGGNTPVFTGDQCWDEDGTSVTMSLNGSNTTLVHDDASGKWKAEADANWRIETLGSPASNGSGSSERWKVTTPDGTRYFFASEPGSSRSRLTVPVFGNHSGEPCKASAFKDSSCRQAYRWLLDKTIDVNGNMVRYFYDVTAGHYGAALDADNRVPYHREARLKRIEYGLRAGDSSVPATGRVVFTSGKRCLSSCGTQSDPNEGNWPDTPWDLACDSAPCTSQLSPSFFSIHRLKKITTQVRDGSRWQNVDSWALSHEFKDYGDDEQVTLWLKSIQHTGHVGGEVTLPKTTFAGEALPNRVDAAEGVPVMWRWRMSSIKSETGGITTITYADPECTPDNLPSRKHNNDMRCYPVRWTPEFFTEPVEDWFHKHVVDSVVATDTTGGGVAVETYYDYSTAGGGTSMLWAFDESEFTDDEHRTYNMWRGYPQVTTRVGDPALTQTVSRNRFYRGLDGQPLLSGDSRSVSVRDAEGNTVKDHEALVGQPWETLSYNGSQVIDGATYRYWKRKTATSSRDHDGGDLEAWLTAVSAERTRTRLTSSAWQRTETRTTFDNEGRATKVNDLGDVAQSGDELCTRNQYSENASKWIKNAMKRIEVVSVACGTSPSRPDDLVSNTKTYFDGSNTHGATPSKGMPTRVDTVDDWDSGPVYVTTRQAYDVLGRVVSATDPLGHTSTTTFTPAGPGPLTRVVDTNPIGHQDTIALEPAWGEQVAVVDANGRRADLEHDPLGQLTAVWLPGRDQASQTPSMEFEYLVRDDAPSAVTTRTLNHAEEYLTAVELYDALLRPRQTQVETHDGGRLVTETVYDTHGRVEEEFGPNPNADPPDTTLVRAREDESARRTGYFYDAAGRVVDEVFYDKHTERWRTTTSYGGSTTGFMVTVQPPEGAPATAAISDARGNTIEKRTFLSHTPTGSYDSTTYEHTPGGQLEQMTDPVGNQWSWEYDLAGRQVATHHPDAGTSTMEYDAAGQMVSVTDARGLTIESSYDELGRQVARHNGSDTLLAEWEYDTVPGGVGMRAKATRWHDGHAYTNQLLQVNDQGLPTVHMVTLPDWLGPLSGDHYFTSTYTPNGQVEARGTQIRGRAFTAEQLSFDHVGNPTALRYREGEDFTKDIVSEATFTRYNEIQSRLLGHESDQRYGYHQFIYEEDTRRLSRSTFDRGASRHSVADLRYSYDDAGNLLSIADVPEDLPGNHELQCFQYDQRRRLVEAWAQGGTSGCATAPSASVLGGPAPYWNSYQHDVSGNRTAETLRIPGQAGVSRDYTYPAAGQPQPHTLREVTGGPEPMSYDYDAAGHTTSRDLGGQVQTLAWNAEGRVASVTESGGDTVEMVYDTAGNRLIRDDGDTVAAFLPGIELTWDRDIDEVHVARYFTHAGQVVAINTGADVADWTYLGADHHGTTTHAVNAFTGVEQVRRSDPYGNPRGQAPPDWPGQQGFVGGVQDPTGLTHIGARSYDPATGRFISADPVLDTGDNQQINGYAYAHNNPVSFTDPAGLIDFESAGKGWGGRSGGRTTVGGNCIDAACTDTVRPDAGSAGEAEVCQCGPNGQWTDINDAEPCRCGKHGEWIDPDAPDPDGVAQRKTYRNGTTVVVQHDGDVYIDGYKLPDGHPDPFTLASEIDELIAADRQNLHGPGWARGRIAGKCLDSIATAEDLCSSEFYDAVLNVKDTTTAVCVNASGAVAATVNGSVSACFATDNAGNMGLLMIYEGNVTPGNLTTNPFKGLKDVKGWLSKAKKLLSATLTGGGIMLYQNLEQLDGTCSWGWSASASVRGIAATGVGFDTNGNVGGGGFMVGAGVGGGISGGRTCYQFLGGGG